MSYPVKVVGLCLVVFCGLLLSSASADEKTKSAKLNELMELSGMVKVMEQARQKNKEQALVYKQELLKQVKESLKTNDPEIFNFFEVEYQKFVNSLEPKWTTEEAVKEYMDLYGSRLTEEEIEQILAYSKSAVGRKSTAVANEVLPLWFEYLTKDNDALFREGLTSFIEKLKKFVTEKQKAQKDKNQP